MPYMLGNACHGAGEGPQRYLDAGAGDVAVSVERVERGEPFRDSASASLAVNKQLARVVRQAVGTRWLPVVLAGSCDVCLGILAGFDHADCGVVWIDAHADFNTPESTVSGFFAGMSLAVITGHCYRSFWAQVGDSTPVPETATLLVGTRDLSPPAERERLERSAIRVVSWPEGRPQADLQASLDELARRVREVYLHVDLDALDPRVAPGVVDEPVAGGLSLPDMEEAIRGVTARFRVRAAALTTYNPTLDRDGKTLRAGLRILEELTA